MAEMMQAPATRVPFVVVVVGPPKMPYRPPIGAIPNRLSVAAQRHSVATSADSTTGRTVADEHIPFPL